MILQVNDLTVSYGAIRAVQGLTIAVEPGELVGIVGPNGAGKSSLLRALSGVILAARGEILFEGRPITREPSHRRVSLGLVQVPEGRAILQTMTVEENLRVAFEHGRDTRSESQVLAEIVGRFPILEQRRTQRAGTLSGGEQQMLALARALVARPKLLLLDEPSLGLAPLIVREVFRVIASLRDRGVSILLVEQNVREALKIVDRGYVLKLGRVVAQGTGPELSTYGEVLGAYLGRGTQEATAVPR